MKTALRLLYAVSISGLVIALLVLSRAGGALASIVPPEVLTGFAAIAALGGYALVEIRSGAPRGVSNSRHANKTGGGNSSDQPQVIGVCRSTEEKVAA